MGAWAGADCCLPPMCFVVCPDRSAGLKSTVASSGFVFDTTPPTVGQLRDGPAPAATAPAFAASLAAEYRRSGAPTSSLADLDYQTSQLSMWITFDGWADDESGLTEYEWAIGTTSDPTAAVPDLSTAPVNVMSYTPISGGSEAITAAATGLPLQVRECGQLLE